MPQNDAIQVRAAARALFQKTKDERLSDYKKLPIPELQTIIESIDSGEKGTAKGPAAKGVAKKGAAKGAAKGSAKVSAENSAENGTVKAAKGSTSKSSPATSKKPSTKGASKGTAKRATTAKPKTAPKKNTAAVANKPKSTMVEPWKKQNGRFVVPKDYEGETFYASNGAGRVTRSPKRGEEGYRAPLDRKAINWNAPWNGGQRGSRAIVLESLREHKGDTTAVFKALKRRAAKMYANVSKPIGGSVEKHLRWHINRTAFDFALATGQHEPGVRAGYGQSDAPHNTRARAKRKPAKIRAKRTAKKGR